MVGKKSKLYGVIQKFTFTDVYLVGIIFNYICGDTHMTVHLPLVTSLAQSISVSSLIIRPFSGLQRAKVITQATPAKSAITLPSFIQ